MQHKSRTAPWEKDDLLDPLAPDLQLASRSSADYRRVSSHGQSFLSAFAGSGLILHGLDRYPFDNSFTRLPTNKQDRAGALDHIFGPPPALHHILPSSIRMVQPPADFSDHLMLCISVSWKDHTRPIIAEPMRHFRLERLQCLKLPEDEQTWENINIELAHHEDLQSLCCKPAFNHEDLTGTSGPCCYLFDGYSNLGFVKERSVSKCTSTYRTICRPT